MARMARLFECDPPDLGQLIEEGLHGHIRDLVVATVNQEGVCLDLVQLVHDGPMFQITRDKEFGRPIPLVGKCRNVSGLQSHLEF